MSEEGVERRLTATLAADVVAYRRPTIDDEAGIRGALNTSCEEPTDSRSGEADPDSLFRRSHPTGRRFSHLLRPQLSIPCRAIAAAIVLLGLSATIAAADPGITAAEIRQTAQDVLSRASYQRELPHERVGSESRETGTPPRTEFETGEPDDAKPAPPERLDDRLEPPEGLGDVARSLLWVLVLVGGALLVFYLLNEVPLLVKQSRDRRDQRTSLKPRSATDELARPSDGGLLDEADRLARQGKYGEAIHVLLLNSLEDLHRRLDVALAPSLTSREILRTVSLTEDAKSALARIVSLAELNHFGGRASSEAEYQTCRENYRRLATVGSEAA